MQLYTRTVEGLFGVIAGVDGDDDDARIRPEAGSSSYFRI